MSDFLDDALESALLELDPQPASAITAAAIMAVTAMDVFLMFITSHLFLS